jgi:hypothetical protein
MQKEVTTENKLAIILKPNDVLAVLGALSITEFLSEESYKKYGEEKLLESIKQIRDIYQQIKEQTGLNT